MSARGMRAPRAQRSREKRPIGLRKPRPLRTSRGWVGTRETARGPRTR